VFRAALLCGLALAALGRTGTAHASSNYPPELARVISKKYPSAVQCVPACTACHLTTVGGPGMMNKFGLSLEKYGLLPGNPGLIENAFNKLADANPDSDGDGKTDTDEIQNGNSPSLAFPDGEGQFCPDIKYGCGAHIAAAPAPAVDRLGLLSAGCVVLGFAALRRRRRAQARRK
jgi:hypothetical protein